MGALPQGLVFPTAGLLQSAAGADIWIPLSLTSAERSPQNLDHSYSLIARLRAGCSPDQAQAAAHSAIEQIASQLPPETRGHSGIQAVVLPLKPQVVAGSQRLLTLLLCAAAALLLISCMNVRLSC